jgi:transcription termination factor Rho
MSTNTNEDTLPEPIADGGKVKRAAKKTTAKKAAVKKTAAKKTAKKAATQAEIPLFVEAPAPKPAPAPAPASEAPAKTPKARKTAAKKTATKAAKADDAPVSRYSAPEGTPAPQAAPAPAPVSQSAPESSEAPRRFGRVPGGGPVVSREQGEQQPSAPVSEAPPAAPEAREAREQREPRENRDNREGGGRQDGNGQQGTTESRSKRRREKRKKRRDQGREGGPQAGGANPQPQQQPRQGRDHSHREQHNNRNGDRDNRNNDPNRDYREDRSGPVQLSGEKIEVDGMLELAPKGFGFLRVPKKNFEQARDDVFVTPEIIRKNHLRLGQWIHGVYQQGPRGPQLVEITTINGMTQEEASKLPHFDELKAINPNKRISFETTPERFTTRVVDIMAPVGKGQRGLIVSPPRSGKTTLLLHMAEAIRTKYEETMHLMVLLVDERPEEVTEFRRALPGAEIYASSNDENARSHCRIAELAIERAKRLVEAGKDVFLLMDSITRLARAYNGNMNNRGRGTGSGGLTIGSLEIPRRLFAAARNTRGGGSLTILATALIQTNSRADEAIFMEFKGTGNMELVLDRKIAENYIYPAVDIFKSGTRREELLLPEHMLHKIHLIRRGLSGHRPAEAMERLLYFLKKFPNNPQMLLEIKG